jgi:carbonic anhydrase/acetyltransferase-like protein (isoleucine patch superfamily)
MQLQNRIDAAAYDKLSLFGSSLQFFTSDYPMPHPTSYRADQVDPSVFLAPGCVVVGDVTMGAESSVWYCAVVRGDTEAIRVGCRTNVQDGAILHADPGFPCTLGDGVTVGHAAIVHGATVADDVLVGMRAVVMNGAKIGAGSIIAAGALVPEGIEVPPGSVVMGMPGKVRRAATETDLERIRRTAEHYVENARRHREPE